MLQVLTAFQLQCPSEPLPVKKTTQTPYNNASGYCFPYGQLAHVVPQEMADEQQPVVQLGKVGDGLGHVVNGVVSSASWYTTCWDNLKAQGESLDCLVDMIHCSRP
jgi:hypothetical protein